MRILEGERLKEVGDGWGCAVLGVKEKGRQSESKLN